METKKGISLLELAYAQPAKKQRVSDLPGKWYDIGIVTLFVFFAVAYFA